MDTAVRIGPASVADSEGTLYTVPGATTSIVKWLHVANVTASEASIRLSIGADDVATRVLSDIPVPAHDILELDVFMPLAAGETLRATGGTDDALTVTGGVVEVS